MRKNIKRMMLLAFMLIMIATPVLADASVGDEIISIGADLTEEEKNQILHELGDNKAQIIEVTNEEEHTYLGGIIPSGQIGNQALSSAKITLKEDGHGLNVDVSDNIVYITEDIYRNALITAGIENAEVVVTAPGKVSGTGALTGIMKAYETITGKSIPEDVKKIANEELVVTYNISKDNNEKEVTDFMNALKVEFAKNMPENEEEARIVIVNISNNYNLNLTDEQIDKLVGLFMKMKNSNIDWNKVSDTATEYTKKASEYLSSEEGQNFLQSLKSALTSFIDWIASLFS